MKIHYPLMINGGGRESLGWIGSSYTHISFPFSSDLHNSFPPPSSRVLDTYPRGSGSMRRSDLTLPASFSPIFLIPCALMFSCPYVMPWRPRILLSSYPLIAIYLLSIYLSPPSSPKRHNSQRTCMSPTCKDIIVFLFHIFLTM